MMKKIVLSLLSLLFPAWVFASSSNSLSFAPPPSDVSVIFLGNIFGIVDGVLHGTGSQIIGTMFGVFNSAVLALGGIVIMYTLIVSTMNTAQEGQMLGQKWSSIWVPLRATIGLGLLIPKASGYCLMQIFVMWVIVQGVGAADKVWGAALSYLNRGGAIVQSQMPPQISLTSGNASVATGASVILQGQVCMYGVQTLLQQALQTYQTAASASTPSGPCVGNVSNTMMQFCNAGQVPDFLSTVNTVSVQSANPTSTANYSVKMPNFPSSSIFASLNGVCGTLEWAPLSASSINSITSNITTLSESELQTAEMSRAIAIQQMYSDLATVSQLMVNNNPGVVPQTNNSGTSFFSAVAVDQYGVPYLSSGSTCTSVNSECTSWGKDPSNNTLTPLFTGTEFQGAIADYNGIMMPTLNLIQEASTNSSANDERAFIEQANAQGWMLAGSYFFNLSILNASATNSNLTDSNTGLDSSSFDPSAPLSVFSGSGNAVSCTGDWPNLCIFLNKQSSGVSSLMSLENGSSGLLDAPLAPPNFNAPTSISAASGAASSTVLGFITNSMLINLPGQPGMLPPSFNMKMNIKINVGQYKLYRKDFPCAGFMCLGSLLGNIFYNLIFVTLFNLFMSILAPFINAIIQTFLSAPLMAIGEIFKQGVAIIEQPSVNPIIALANMGVNYINLANQLWILFILLSATPLIAIVFPIIALILPLLMSWMGIMVGIAFITAYYIPFLPYMIFTFGSIAWLMAVIEAMVAAPIVALGVTHPEGHDAFGKGEQAIMILMNVFLRPSMMIIGYIAAISLSYVSVWIINSGFANAAAFVQGTSTTASINYSFTNTYSQSSSQVAANVASDFSSMETGYSGWAGIYGFFFSVIIYTMMYLTVVQKAFTLITYLPDKVLRWIGGQGEGIGEQAAQWAEGEPRKQVEAAGAASAKASQQRDQQLSGYVEKWLGKGKGGGGKSSIQGFGGEATKGE